MASRCICLDNGLIASRPAAQKIYLLKIPEATQNVIVITRCLGAPWLHPSRPASAQAVWPTSKSPTLIGASSCIININPSLFLHHKHQPVLLWKGRWGAALAGIAYWIPQVTRNIYILKYSRLHKRHTFGKFQQLTLTISAGVFFVSLFQNTLLLLQSFGFK